MAFPMSQNQVNLVKSQRKYGMFGVRGLMFDDV